MDFSIRTSRLKNSHFAFWHPTIFCTTDPLNKYVVLTCSFCYEKAMYHIIAPWAVLALLGQYKLRVHI